MLQPLAERLRPKNLDEYIGQEHIGEGGVPETTWKRKTRLIKQTLLPCIPSVTYTFKF